MESAGRSHPDRPAVPRPTRWDKTFPDDPAAPFAADHDGGGPDDHNHRNDNQDGGPDETAAPKPRSKWRTPVMLVGLVLIAAIIGIALHGKLPGPSEIWNAVTAANWWWVALGAAMMAISVSAFAEQQRILLVAFDTRISRGRMTTITYGGTAVTNSLPAGAAVAAGFSFTQYRAGGANRSTAATVMVLSGLLSIGALALMYFMVLGTATATSFITLLATNPVVAVVFGLLAAAVVVLLVRRSLTVAPAEVSGKDTPRLNRFEQRYPKIGSLARDGLETVRQARLVKVRYLSAAIGWSLVKWAAEAFCLLASCWAFGVQIDLVALAVVYLSVQLIRQVPFTPGGLGLVEASLLAALVSAGALHGAAAAAVVVYRLLSAWLIIPIGFALLAEMKRRDARRAAAVT